MENVNQLIRNYGQLLGEARRYRMYNMPVPAEISFQIQQMESFSSAYLNPNAQRQAARMAEGYAQQYLNDLAQQHQQTQQQQFNATLERRSESLTRGMANQMRGLSSEQFRDVRDGKKIKVKNNKPRFNRDLLNELSLKQNGKTIEKMEENLDHAVEVMRKGDDKATAQTLQRYGLTRQQVEQYAEGQFGYKWHKRQAEHRQNEPDEYHITPTESDQRKAQLIDAWAKVEGEIPTDDRVDPSYTDESNDNIQGDIARAYEYHLEQSYFDDIEQRSDAANY